MLSPVSQTAVGVARVRAAESRRPDALFRDPFAAGFVEAAGLPPRTEPPGPGALALAAHVIVRTRFYDEHLAASPCRQVVLLAAGLDARAYRLEWAAGTRVFEADLEPVLEFKQRVLDASGAQPRCARTAVAVDLRWQDWPEVLTAAGFDPGQPTAWLVEGLLVYLSREEAGTVLTRLTAASAPGSSVALEQGSGRRIPEVEGVTTLWRGGGLGGEAVSRLRDHGWEVTLTGLGEAAERYGRPFGRPTESAFATGVRRG